MYTVTDVVNEAKWLLEDTFGTLSVSGEISGVKQSAPGHLYFTLKDDSATLSCVMWASNADRLKFRVEDGLTFIATGNLTIYPPQGRFQFMIRRLVPEGIGALQLAFEQLKKKLLAEGLFDESHKKPVPSLPLRVGVITSLTGAAIRDFLKMLRPVSVPMEISIFPAHVQGKQAVSDMLRGIKFFSTRQISDVIVITRGGGSWEDLQPFNEEPLARAVFLCPVPVISAVGHEVDTTITDFVSDLRLPTPTAAGEFLAARIQDQVEKIRHFSDILSAGVTELLEGEKERLFHAARVFNMKHLQESLAGLRSHLIFLKKNIRSALRLRVRLAGHDLIKRKHSLHRLTQSFMHDRARRIPDSRYIRQLGHSVVDRERENLHSHGRQLHLLNPRQVLHRGYSITIHPDRGIVRQAKEVNIGEAVNILLSKGTLTCRVNEKK